MRILDERQEKLLKDERDLLNDLHIALVEFGASQVDQETLKHSTRQLDDLFLLVVVGEFNSGKSAFINALLGDGVLKEGATPTTTQITILRYGEERERRVESENLHVITAPVDILSEISIVDTPGTNAVIREHEQITSQFVPRSDLVLFITSVDRPFTESERTFLERIRDWGKKVVVVISKIDILQSQADLKQVKSFVGDNSRTLFGFEPEIFPVSARQALQAKQGQPSLWESSRFEPLETYIHDTLDESGRLRLKFLSPLGVGLHLGEKYIRTIDDRLNLLSEDFSLLEDVETQLKLYREDMERDFHYRMSDLENVLFEMEQRGLEYFDETLRLGRVFDLMNKERIRRNFEQQVVANVPQQIENKVTGLIDWLVDSDFRQWQAVMEHLAERRRQHEDRIVGDAVGGNFHHDRERLIEGVGREAQRVVEGYDKKKEAEAIAVGAQNAVAAAAAMEVGAVGLGTLVTILATTVAADVTGILLASLVAVLGLFVIPARRRRAKAEMHEKIDDLRSQIVGALGKHFEREIDRSLQNIREAIAPYTRFVRAERKKLEDARGKLDDIQIGLTRLQVRIEEL